MKEHNVMQAMRKAHIPPYALTTNFEKTGLIDLRARITSAAVLGADTPVNFYLHARTNTKKAMQDCAVAVGLLAKALVISRKDVIYVNLAGMLREVRLAEMEREARSINPVLDHIGRGYIAIGDFLEFADVEQKYGYHAVQLVADYLISHLERGGGLILGASSIEPIDATQYGAAFGATLASSFESYRI